MICGSAELEKVPVKICQEFGLSSDRSDDFEQNAGNLACMVSSG